MSRYDTSQNYPKHYDAGQFVKLGSEDVWIVSCTKTMVLGVNEIGAVFLHLQYAHTEPLYIGVSDDTKPPQKGCDLNKWAEEARKTISKGILPF